MKRKLVLVIIFILYGSLTARAEDVQLPVPHVKASVVFEPARYVPRDFYFCKIDINVILEDLRPQKIDMDHFRNAGIVDRAA